MNELSLQIKEDFSVTVYGDESRETIREYKPNQVLL